MGMKKLIKKNSWLVCIVIGLVIVMIPTIELIKLKNKNIEAVKYLDTLKAEVLKENENKNGDFEFENIENVNSVQLLIKNDDITSCPIIGQLIISSLDINLPISKGMEKENLHIGVGTMKDEQQMGQGNYAIAGHYVKNDRVLFARLLDIKKGDIVSITDKDTVYEYEVYETVVVSESEVDLVSDDVASERGNPIITLMTCYYSSKTGKRFFAFADLINKYTFTP